MINAGVTTPANALGSHHPAFSRTAALRALSTKEVQQALPNPESPPYVFYCIR